MNLLPYLAAIHTSATGRLMALCLLAVATAACGQGDTSNPTLTPRPSAPALPDPTRTPRAASVPTVPPTLLVPTPTPEIHSSTDPVYSVSPSLEEQVFFSDAIVRASLLSASAGTESVPSDPGVAPTYRAVHELRFTVHEYLKGSGPSEVLVVVRDEDTFVAETDALSWAQEQLTGARDDLGRPGGRSLLADSRAVSVGRSVWRLSAQHGAKLSRAGIGVHPVQLCRSDPVGLLDRHPEPRVDAVRGRRVLGAPVVGVVEHGQAGAGVHYRRLAVSSAGGLALDLRSKIAELETTLASGAGIEGFRECIWDKIYYERTYRAGPAWTPPEFEATLASGSAIGAEVHRRNIPNYRRGPQYHRFWLSGPHVDLFQSGVEDDDTVPDNGYDHTLVLARPLPAGEYHVNDHMQHHDDFPCNFVPDTYSKWTVTVTAPAGTVHEAFFDPVAIGAAVGADSSNGVLKPAAFTVGGASATITSLKWESGVVRMLNPSASLAGHAIDFIALDGSVALTLSFDNATQSGGALTWSVADQPWQAGDLLMLRIRAASP